MKRIALIFFPMLALLCAVYSPVLTLRYAHHDDYRFFESISDRDGFHPFMLTDTLLGRITNAFMEQGLYHVINLIGDLNAVRFLAILFFAIGGTLVAMVLARGGFSWIEAFLMAGIIFTLPPFQVLAAYAAAASKILALIFSASAAWIALAVPTEGTYIKRFASRQIGLAVFLLFLAFTIYQSLATYFFVMVLIYFVFPADEDSSIRERRFEHLAVVGLAGLGVYFLYLKSFEGFAARFIPQDLSYSPYAMNFDLIANLTWFAREPLFNALNIWEIFPNTRNVVFVCSIIVVASFIRLGMFLQIRGGKGSGKLYFKMMLYVGVIGALLILSFLPNLLAAHKVAFYRCCAALTSMLVIFLFWAIRECVSLVPPAQRKWVFPGILFLLMIYGTVQARANIMEYRIIPSQTEYEFIYKALERVELKRISRLDFIVPQEADLKSRYDEFGVPTSFFPQDYKGLFNVIFEQSQRENPFLGSRVRVRVLPLPMNGKPPADFYEGQDSIVVDIRTLYAGDGPLNSLEK